MTVTAGITLRVASTLSFRSGSERIPGRRRGELQVADIGAEAKADAGADRHNPNAARGRRRPPQPADEMGRAVDAAEALIDRVGARQVVDQHHGASAFAAGIEAERRALPVHTQIAGVPGIKRAFAVAQS